MLEFDPEKDAANIAKHGVSLARADELEIEAYVEDHRFDELRYRAYGRLDGQTFCLALTLRNGATRAISLRRTHWKEYRKHVS